MSSYLENRTQRVVIHGEKSEPRTLEAGVPQGSILGPLLFIIYTNDLTDHINTNIRLYADDISIFEQGTNQNTTDQNLNQDLENLTKWAEDWHVKLNPEKTMRQLHQKTVTTTTKAHHGQQNTHHIKEPQASGCNSTK